MSEKIGRFEILGEIAHSETSCIYKASDLENGQTVALKTIQPGLPAEQTAELIRRALEEAEATKVLGSHNIALLYGAGEIEGQFCAAMEYVQGKSVASMLAQQESFSMWDLLDITRQSCQGLDHAHMRKVVHYSLEPSKLMVSWDGTVKILAFGISTLAAAAAQANGPAPESLRYMSPEQVRGEPLDARSNLFSIGAILYEMVTNRTAFAGEDAEQVRQEIMVGMPVAPQQLNSKINPALSEVIMRALSKDPDQRYQSGQDLVNDLENCKTGDQKAAPRKMPQVKAERTDDDASQREAEGSAYLAQKASAAAAGQNPVGGFTASGIHSTAEASLSVAAPESEVPVRRAPVPQVTEPAGNGTKRPSFSDMDSLPPLKQVYVAPPPPPAPIAEEVPEIKTHATMYEVTTDKPKEKVVPAEIAKKAVGEIKKTPPKLFLYSIGAAVLLILLVVLGIYAKLHSENDDDGSVARTKNPAVSAEPANDTPEVAPVPDQSIPQDQDLGKTNTAAKPKPVKRKTKVVEPAAPVIIPGQLTINSTPEGAQIQLDGHHDPAWVTPFNLTGLNPGQHSVSISRAGFAVETRNIEVGSGSKSFLVVQLAALGATVLVNSTPSGADIFLDGKDLGKVTPSQLQIDKPGNHTFLVKKQGFLDETTTMNLAAGQSVQFAPALKALGNTDDIKLAGGKFKKMFGGSGDVAGTGMVSIKTQPKGAQITVNRHMVDKTSPVDFYLNPGTYVIDITLSGYKDVHRVINVDKGGKVSVEETLERP